MIGQPQPRNIDITVIRINLSAQMLNKVYETNPGKSATFCADKAVELTDALLVALQRPPKENTSGSVLHND